MCGNQRSECMGRAQLATTAPAHTHGVWMNCCASIVLTTPSGEIFRI